VPEQRDAGVAAAEVEADLPEAARTGVSGVPLFVVDNGGLSGAHPPEHIMRFLDVVTGAVPPSD
jgi:predicted DsbA family dithiol-disulfide isomerase